LKENEISPATLLKRSLVPYTKKAAFSVVETTDNCFYAGVRVENLVYPLTIESAQSAIATAITQGKKPAKIHTWVNPEFEAESSLSVYSSKFELAHITHLFSENLPELNTPKILANVDDFSTTDWPKTQNSAVISQFLVAALLKTGSGWLLGTNFEHAFLGIGLCAERTALAMALRYELPIENEIYIFTKNRVLATPCGACRQVGSELLPNSTTAFLLSDKHNKQTVKWAELLPFPFVLS